MPYQNEHAARVKNPNDFEENSFKRKNITSGVDIIIGKLKGSDTTTTQSYRFDKSQFNVSEAKKWLNDNNVEYISFEQAEENAKKRELDLFVYGDIGTGIDGKEIADKIVLANQEKSHDIINVHINTDGGHVSNGFYIVSSILNSKIPVHTYNDFRAYSMGGIIWLSAKKENRHIASFASNMFHSPNFGAKVNLSKEEKEYLEKVKDQFNNYLSQTGSFSDEDIQNIMTKDVFMSSSECVDKGLCEKENVFSIYQMPQYLNKIAAFYNSQNINNNFLDTKKLKEMDFLKRINAKLGLNEEAHESVTIDAFNKLEGERNTLQAKVTDLQKANSDILVAKNNEITELKAKLESFEAKEKELQNKIASDFVEMQIKAGKFDEKEKETLVAMAQKDLEGFKSLCEKFTVKNVKTPDVVAEIDLTKNEFGIAQNEFNYETLEAKHPVVLEEIRNKNPKLYEKLEEMYIKKYQ